MMLAAAALAIALQANAAAPAANIPSQSGSVEAQAAADRLEAAADAMRDGSEQVLPKATRADVVTACALAERFHNDVRVSGSGSAGHADDLAERLRAMAWKALPDRAGCGRLGKLTFQPKGFGRFVTHVAQSDDNRFVGLRGGWQAAPLAGGGADCLYERRGVAMTLVGCTSTWVS